MKMTFITAYSVLIVLASLITDANAASIVTPGHTAAWYDPSRSGEGWVLEVLNDDRAVVYFYTYNEEGGQRWLTGAGEVKSDDDGRFIEIPTLYVTRGGKFGPDFDPDDVIREPAGNAIFRFFDCRNGTATYEALGDVRETPLRRLSRTMGTKGCTPRNGIPGEPVMEYGGQSGSWYDRSHSGEGFTVHWLADGSAMSYWFSYDAEGNQAWFFGVGQEQDGQIVFDNLLSTEGARFGEAFDTADVNHVEWGAMQMSLACNDGEVTYQSQLPEYGEGEQSLSRLSRLRNLACPYVKPKLIDLYEFTWTEVPVEEGAAQDPVSIRARAIADDGTIVATIGLKAGIRRPGEDWELLEGSGDIATPIFVTSDSNRILTTQRGEEDAILRRLITWEMESGWQQLLNLEFDSNVLAGASDDRDVLVGSGQYSAEIVDEPWVWTREWGQIQLPETELIRGAVPVGVSNDARIIVGRSGRAVPGYSHPVYIATRWEELNEPELLVDEVGRELGAVRACNANCQVVTGGAQAEYQLDHPAWGQAWIWQKGKGAQYLGEVPDGGMNIAFPYIPTDLTPDGSLIIGNYAMIEPGTTNQLSSRAFIWTQATGLVTVRQIMEELGIGDDDWDDMLANSVTSSGDMILLGGNYLYPSLGGDGRNDRAVVLGLQPK